MKEIQVKGQDYVLKSDNLKCEVDTAGMPYCIVRTYSAGVFAGYMRSRKGREVELVNARRLWYWSGAASLSELAMHGVKEPGSCKFPCEVSEVILTQAIEILNVTEKAKKSIDNVPIWKA